MLPEKLPTDPDGACELSRRWLLEPALARGLVSLNRWMAGEFAKAGLRGPVLWIISGYRSPQRQAIVNPAAPNSLHTRCPSMAADLRLGESDPRLATGELWAILGGRWRITTGGRWGGDFDVPPGQINTDEMNHFDLG